MLHSYTCKREEQKMTALLKKKRHAGGTKNKTTHFPKCIGTVLDKSLFTFCQIIICLFIFLRWKTSNYYYGSPLGSFIVEM